jgi:hypothetical protein
MTSDAVDTHRHDVADTSALLLHHRRHLLPSLPHGSARVTNIMVDEAAKTVTNDDCICRHETRVLWCRRVSSRQQRSPPSPFCTSCQPQASVPRPHMVPSPLDPCHCTTKRVTLTVDRQQHRSTRGSRSTPSLTPPSPVLSHLKAVTKVTNILPCDKDVSTHIHSDLPPISCLRSDVD